MTDKLHKTYFDGKGCPRFDDGSTPNAKTWKYGIAEESYTFGAATWDQWRKSLEDFFGPKRWTHSTYYTFKFNYLNGLLTLWLFFVIQAACSPLKKFVIPRDIETATGPFVDEYLYVDKTHLARELCERDGGRYFFVRPRRFGKSTFLETIRAIFDGRGQRILNGTYIHKAADYKWDTYPVLYMDLGGFAVERDETCRGLMRIPRNLTLLEWKVRSIFREFKTQHCLSRPEEYYLPLEFKSILEEIRDTRNRTTVVLIDEYDFAILNNMVKCPAAANLNAELVRDIFLQTKAYDGLIKFAFITGISKAVYSTLGSAIDLIDITHDPGFHNIAGLTESDLKEHYCDHIEAAADHVGEPASKVIKTLKEWYDGYNFSTRVRSSLYNPWSVQSYLRNKHAKGYWTDKDHARFLYQQMVLRPEAFSSLNLVEGVESKLQGAGSLNSTDPIVLLFDAGYLSIQSFRDGYYTLGFPNVEMRRNFYESIAEAAEETQDGTRKEVEQIRIALTRPIPDFKGFIKAIDGGIAKLAMRAPFEEWYDWQTTLLMKYAGIKAAERQCDIEIVPSASNNNKKTKIVDITGRSEYTFFLFEVKFERQGCSEAWNDAKESIRAHLDRNKEEQKPLNILAAGITFTGNRKKKPVEAYKAKLFAPNGTVLRKYFSSNKIKNDPASDEIFVIEEMPR